ncbi:unnamed protein product [Phaeothamnion confervicola]
MIAKAALVCSCLAALHGVSALRLPLRASATASRPRFIRSWVGAAVAASTLPPVAGAASTQTYTDQQYGITFDAPSSWTRDEKEITGRRRLIVFADPDDPTTNAFIAYTPIRGDFISLGSFGTVDDVSHTVLPEGEGISSELVRLEAKNRTYIFDYIVRQTGRPDKRIKTRWYVVPGNQLVTVTAQCDDSKHGGPTGTTLDGIISSFRYAAVP